MTAISIPPDDVLFGKKDLSPYVACVNLFGLHGQDFDLLPVLGSYCLMVINAYIPANPKRAWGAKAES